MNGPQSPSSQDRISCGDAERRGEIAHHYRSGFSAVCFRLRVPPRLHVRRFLPEEARTARRDRTQVDSNPTARIADHSTRGPDQMTQTQHAFHTRFGPTRVLLGLGLALALGWPIPVRPHLPPPGCSPEPPGSGAVRNRQGTAGLGRRRDPAPIVLQAKGRRRKTRKSAPRTSRSCHASWLSIPRPRASPTRSPISSDPRGIIPRPSRT